MNVWMKVPSSNTTYTYKSGLTNGEEFLCFDVTDMAFFFAFLSIFSYYILKKHLKARKKVDECDISSVKIKKDGILAGKIGVLKKSRMEKE